MLLDYIILIAFLTTNEIANTKISRRMNRRLQTLCFYFV